MERLPDILPAIADWLEDLSEKDRNIARRIREAHYRSLPEVSETWKWKTPVFVYHRNLTYLSKGKEGLILGFMYGALLEDPAGILAATDRQQIRHIVFSHLEEGPWEELPYYLQEAAILNESKQKISRNKI